MKVLVFDTETTGLPKQKGIPAKQAPGNWPHIVSISWVMMEDDIVIDTQSFIVRPDGWEIPLDSTAIHGITHAQAVKVGYSLDFVMDKFTKQYYDIMIAHNMEFDENVVANAMYWDLGRKNFLGLPPIKKCSMRESQSICKLPSQYSGFKPPKLSELYKYVFGTTPVMAKLHNSLYDVEVLVRILQTSPELRNKLGLTKSPLIKYNDRQTKPNVLRL